MSGIPMCPVHGTAMKVSKHDPDGFYCPKKVGDGYCDQTAKAPAPPPTPAPVAPQPPPPPAVYANGNGEREARITRLACLKVAAQMCANTENGVAVQAIIDIARPLYRWAMGFGPHWVEDDTTRKKFWAWTRDTMALNNGEVHDALHVSSIEDFEGAKAEAMAAIQTYVKEKTGG